MFSGLLVSAQERPAPQRVHIIFNYGAEPPDGVATYNERTELTRRTYEEQGYRVIVLQPGTNNTPTRQNLEQALSQLGSNVGELGISFFGHGEYADEAATRGGRVDSTRFPMQTIPPALAGSGARGADQVAGRSAAPYLIASPITTSPPSDTNHIGMGDLMQMVNRFRGQNPTTPVTIDALPCFSGAIGRALAHIPNTQVYAATSEATKAMTFFQSAGTPGIDYSRIFNEGLGRGLTRHEAHNAAVTQLLDLVRRSPERGHPAEFYHMLPRSPIQSYVNEWCAANSQSGSINPTVVPDRVVVGAMNEIRGQLQRFVNLVDHHSQQLRCGAPANQSILRQDASEASTTMRRIAQRALDDAVSRLGALSDEELESRMRSGLTRAYQSPGASGRRYGGVPLETRVAQGLERIRRSNPGGLRGAVSQLVRRNLTACIRPEEARSAAREGAPETSTLADQATCQYLGLEGLEGSLNAYGLTSILNTGSSTETIVADQAFNNCSRATAASDYLRIPAHQSPRRQERACIERAASTSTQPYVFLHRFVTMAPPLATILCPPVNGVQRALSAELSCLQRFGARASAADVARVRELIALGNTRIAGGSAAPVGLPAVPQTTTTTEVR